VCFIHGREYREEMTSCGSVVQFGAWLGLRCCAMSVAEQEERPDLMAISRPPSRKVCAFSGMKSYGSHYRVDMEEGSPKHVTFDSGVAELQTRRRGASLTSSPAHV
jgi:hypothetical protein